MALIDSEGFGFSTNAADYATYGLLVPDPSSPAIAAVNTLVTGGPLGDNYFTVANGNRPELRNLPAAATTFFFGARVNLNGGATPAGFVFCDSSANNQLYIRFNATGSISVIGGAAHSSNFGYTSGGTLIGTAPAGTVPTTGWFHFEVGATIDATSGSVTLRVNGATVLALSGDNTKGSASSATVAILGIQPTGGTSIPLGTTHWYFCDNTGSAPWNTFLGDVRVQTLVPTSNDTVQFTPATGVVQTDNPLGTSNTAASSANSISYRAVVPAVGGTITGIQLSLGVALTGHIQAALYADNGGQPGSLLCSSAVLTNPGTGVQTFTVTSGPHLSAGTTYWVGFLADASFTPKATSSGTDSAFSQSQTYASGFPASATPASGTTSSLWHAVVLNPTNTDIAAVVPPSPSTAFNADANVGDQDTFNCAPMATNLSTVYGVHVKALGLKSDAGARSLQTVLKSGATTDLGTSTALGTSAGQIKKIYQTDPNTGAQWTQANVNAAKPGYKVSA